MNMTCEGCGQTFNNFFDAHPVCNDCVRARARTATAGRHCHCGSKRRPSAIKQAGSRRWISCLRCLGQIKQLS